MIVIISVLVIVLLSAQFLFAASETKLTKLTLDEIKEVLKKKRGFRDVDMSTLNLSELDLGKTIFNHSSLTLA